MSDALDTYIAALQSLTAERLDDLMLLVAKDVHFRDPFNDCRGRERYRAVLDDMFRNLKQLRFCVDQASGVWLNGDGPNRTGLIKWTLSAELHHKPWRVEGCSEIRFDPDGLVVSHYDYWDAAAGLYERFPVVGVLLRALRRRIRVG